jgi:hypothetical protein
MSQVVEKKLDLEKAFFEMDPPKLIFVASSNYNWVQYLEERSKKSTSQSCVFLAKLRFHWLEPPKNYRLFAIEVSFATAIPNRAGKAALRVIFPTHRSCQKLILIHPPL